MSELINDRIGLLIGHDPIAHSSPHQLIKLPLNSDRGALSLLTASDKLNQRLIHINIQSTDQKSLTEAQEGGGVFKLQPPNCIDTSGT